jgi:type II secretory pathway predicted ATPase ExeA
MRAEVMKMETENKLVPFSRNPKNEMLFGSSAYMEALARMQLMVQHRYFGVLTGEVGSGKSTLVRHLVQTLDPMRYQVIYLSQAGMKPRDFYGEMLRHLGEEPLFSLTKAKRLFEEVLRTRVEQGDKSLVVIIDEAQDITPAMLLELRFALNQQMDSVSLFTLILVGQSELRRTLRKNKFEAVAQRIQLRFHLTGLTEEESAAYIRHQMKTAAMTSPLFSDSALQLIYSATQGIPRLINHICTYALYDAQQRGSDVVEDKDIGRILADMERQRGTAG